MSKELAFISHTTWNTVLADWREREADHWGWEAHWKEKGFASWDAWREQFYAKLDLQNKQWSLYTVTNPNTFIPTMWAVAFHGWRRYYKEDATRTTFEELVEHPDVATNKKVANLLQAFPEETTIIILKNGDEFALFEGMHRCSAIALAQKQGRVLNTNLTAAVANIDTQTFRRITTQQPK